MYYCGMYRSVMISIDLSEKAHFGHCLCRRNCNPNYNCVVCGNVALSMTSLLLCCQIPQLYFVCNHTGEQKAYFYFFKGCERYNQEVLSHSFICLPLPYMEGIVLICNIDLYCVIAIFNGTGDIFNR